MLLESPFPRIGQNQGTKLLCDIGPPDGSGYAVVSEAKRRHPVKAVAITGFGTEADVRRSTEAGFDFHLVKPVDLRELQDALDQVAAEFA
jgi:CheY-like chemotaxis protein